MLSDRVTFMLPLLPTLAAPWDQATRQSECATDLERDADALSTVGTSFRSFDGSVLDDGNRKWVVAAGVVNRNQSFNRGSSTGAIGQQLALAGADRPAA